MEKARITIQTSVGNTEEILVKDVVKQGTDNGPDFCGMTTIRINTIGKDIVTFYRPELVIQATTFVDDISCA